MIGDARLPAELVAGPIALVNAAAALVLIVGVLRAGRTPGGAGGILAAHAGLSLELLLAAGIIRLAALETLRSLATVAGIVAIRQVVGRGVRAGASASGR